MPRPTRRPLARHVRRCATSPTHTVRARAGPRGRVDWARGCRVRTAARRSGRTGRPAIDRGTTAQGPPLIIGPRQCSNLPPTSRLASPSWPIPAEQWPAECFRQAKRYPAITPQAVQTSRQELLDRLNAVESPAPRSLVRMTPGRCSCFGRLLARWSRPTCATRACSISLMPAGKAAPLIWNDPALVEASLAVRSYVQLYRAYLANESSEQYAAAWTALGKLLESNHDAASPMSTASRRGQPTRAVGPGFGTDRLDPQRILRRNVVCRCARRGSSANWPNKSTSDIR